MHARVVVLLAFLSLLACRDGTPTGATPDGLSLTKVGGDEQTGEAGTRLPEPITVLVERTDETHGTRPVEGAVVTFVVAEGGGGVENGTTVTGVDGLAEDHWTLGPRPGINKLEVTASPGDGTEPVRAFFTAYGEAPPLPFADPSAIAAGQSHSCALDSAGTAYCWGRGALGQLGDGSRSNRAIPGRVGGSEAFVSLVAGLDHTCGLSRPGVAYCWGRNDAGQLGDGTVIHKSAPTAVQAAPTFLSLAAGDHHTCGLTPTGTAHCWGLNGFGQLGDGTTTQRSLPTEVVGGLELAKIAAGDSHSCGSGVGGTVYCWGLNGFGQLGDGTTTQRSVPTPMGGSVALETVVGGAWHGCGLDASGVAHCWGNNSMGQLGDGTVRNRFTAAPVAGALRFRSLASRSFHTCGIERVTGAAYCWGRNLDGQLGDGTTFNRAAPTAVAGLRPFVALQTGTGHSCGVAASGDAWCWGHNPFGQLGDGTVARRLIPTRVLDWPPS